MSSKRKQPNEIKPDVRSNILADVNAGGSFSKVALKFNVDRNTISRIVHRDARDRGVEYKAPNLDESKRKALEMIRDGTSIEHAALACSIGERTISRHIRFSVGSVAKMRASNPAFAKLEAAKVEPPASIFDKPADPAIRDVPQWGRFAEGQHPMLRGFSKFVIASVQNDAPVHKGFYDALKLYCAKNGAKLLILPVKYHHHDFSIFNVDEGDLFYEDVNLSRRLKLLPRLTILPTIVDPLAGVDPLSKGDSMIVAHPQIAMRTLPTLENSPAQMWSCGSICVGDGIYQKTKTGHKAEDNHSLAALVVELGKGDSFHIRALNADGDGGFYDCPRGLEGYYSPSAFHKLSAKNHIPGIYLGDSHLSVADQGALRATFTDADSIMNVLRPKEVVHGDIFDCQSVSHHDENDYLTRWGKYSVKVNDMEKEFDLTFDTYAKIMPEWATGLIDASNHNDHAYKFLTTADPRKDLVNSKIYHKLNWLMMDAVEKSPSGPKFPNLIELWLKNSRHAHLLPRMEFLGRKTSRKIKGIEVSMHGDKGPNGAKGSPAGFARMPVKVIVGHSHTPSIRLGCYTVGTTSRMDLSYTGGPSSWMHSHCLIWPNGKRQMISIINGKWRA